MTADYPLCPASDDGQYREQCSFRERSSVASNLPCVNRHAEAHSWADQRG